MANPEHLAKLREGVEAWNAWRRANPGVRPDLSGSRLEYIELRGVNMCEADLHEVDLRGATLPKADFSRANLTRVILYDAVMTGANLSRADLTSADLSGVFLNEGNLQEAILDRTMLAPGVIGGTLEQTDFREADLQRAVLRSMPISSANFCRATFGETILAQIDLSSALGLSAARHRYPSSVDIETIYRSKGKIPDVFLRGCGVPENFISYAKSLVENPIEFYSCFISYSHADASFARRLHDALQDRGIRCWLDEHQLLPGDDFHDKIDRGIKIWDKILLCASKSSLNSPWVDRELDKALQKEERLWKERGEKVLALVPLNLDDHLFTGAWPSGKASLVTGRLAADFNGWETDNAKFEREFEKVVRALRTGDGGREPAPVPRL